MSPCVLSTRQSPSFPSPPLTPHSSPKPLIPPSLPLLLLCFLLQHTLTRSIHSFHSYSPQACSHIHTPSLSSTPESLTPHTPRAPQSHSPQACSHIWPMHSSQTPGALHQWPRQHLQGSQQGCACRPSTHQILHCRTARLKRYVGSGEDHADE